MNFLISKKRNGEMRYVKTKWRSSICQNEMEKFAYQTGSGQTGLRRLVKQIDRTNRFRSTLLRQTGQRRTASDKLSRLSIHIRFLDSNRLSKVLIQYYLK